VRWALVIDESGKFARRKDDVTVAGVLLPAASASVLGRTLRQAMLDADPRCPWPLHSAHLRTLTWLAAARTTELQRQGPGGHRDVGQACEQILDALESYRRRQTERVFQDIATGSKGDWDNLQDLERWLDSRRNLRWAKRTLRRHQGGLFDRVARTVKNFTGEEQRRGLGMWAFTASESMRGNACDSPLSPDRYVALLQVLIERAADMLYRAHPEHTLVVRPFVRHVALGGPRRPLQAADVAVLVRQAQLPQDLAIVADPPSDYPGTHPGTGFLADLLANTARIQRGQLDALHLELRHRTGLWATSGPERRSHCAAHIKARDYILAARAGDAPPQQSLAGLRPWARDQALSWGAE